MFTKDTNSKKINLFNWPNLAYRKDGKAKHKTFLNFGRLEGIQKNPVFKVV